MKYIPKRAAKNHNAPPGGGIGSLAVLLVKFSAAVLAVYWLLGVIVSRAVVYIPRETEGRLFGTFSSLYFRQSTDFEGAARRLNELAQSMVRGSELEALPPRVIVVDSPLYNAVTFPGGVIAMFSEILKRAESENEVALVLAHEIGHVLHRDNMKGMGRGLLLIWIYALGTGGDAPDALLKLLGFEELSFSREQELDADAAGLRMLVKHYGHAGGAYRFFERAQAAGREAWGQKYFGTHPPSAHRIARMKSIIEQHHWTAGELASVSSLR